MKRLLVLLAIAGCGSSGTGGGGGSGGSAEVVTTDAATRACVAAVACGLTLVPLSYESVGVTGCASGVMWLNEPSYAAAYRIGPHEVNCIAGAGSSCDAVKSCVNGGHGAQACKLPGGCDGSIIYGCGSNFQTQFDCASAGQTCYAGTSNRCVTGLCQQGSQKCNGNVLETCNGTFVEQEDCGAENAICAAISGGARCQPGGAACTLTTDHYHFDGLRCEGTTLITCGASEVPRDCARLGLGCVPVMDAAAGGASMQVARCQAGSACDPFSTPAACNGTQLTFCNNGLSTTVDCAALGYAACQADQGGRCTP
jgi:hypothetical protein